MSLDIKTIIPEYIEKGKVMQLATVSNGQCGTKVAQLCYFCTKNGSMSCSLVL
jgi:hypothetical protein